jgi:hypothetical protein
MERAWGQEPEPAEIGSGAYAYPADPLCFFYYTLGLERLKRAKERVDRVMEGARDGAGGLDGLGNEQFVQ